MMNKSFNNHCKDCQSKTKLLIKDSSKSYHWFCHIASSCPFTQNPMPTPKAEEEIKPTHWKEYSILTSNHCLRCGGNIYLIPADKHFTGKSQNKCIDCLAIQRGLQ